MNYRVDPLSPFILIALLDMKWISKIGITSVFFYEEVFKFNFRLADVVCVPESIFKAIRTLRKRRLQF